jgi:hypothetical protein
MDPARPSAAAAGAAERRGSDAAVGVLEGASCTPAGAARGFGPAASAASSGEGASNAKGLTTEDEEGAAVEVERSAPRGGWVAAVVVVVVVDVCDFLGEGAREKNKERESERASSGRRRPHAPRRLPALNE